MSRSPRTHPRSTHRNYLGLILASSTLPERLRRRTEVERAAARTGRTFRRHPQRIYLEKLFVRSALQFALRATGLYARGVKNALDVRLKHMRLAFQDLPREFDGFRILHLSDLHIDSLPELASAVAEALSGVHADMVVMTGDYRCEIEGPCE